MSAREPFKVWDHIGVISAVVLGLVVLGFLIVLAAAGYEAALAIIVLLVIGVAFIYFGGRLSGGHDARISVRVRGDVPGRGGRAADHPPRRGGPGSSPSPRRATARSGRWPRESVSRRAGWALVWSL